MGMSQFPYRIIYQSKCLQNAFFLVIERFYYQQVSADSKASASGGETLYY